MGFYLRMRDEPRRGSIVTVRASDVAPAQARAHRFERPTDRFIKRIAALAGDEICATASDISINGQFVAERRTVDGEGRALPRWQGCRTLRIDEFFLLGDTTDSFDARYWGPVRRSQIEGVWRRL